MPRRFALLIGCDDYDSSEFNRLGTPVTDIQALADLLRDEDVGRFDEVVVIPDGARRATHSEVRLAIEEFFQGRQADDLLVLCIGSHGRRAVDGELYFVLQDTVPHRLHATAVSSKWVSERVEQSWSQRVVVLLDCCHSGAYRARGTSRATSSDSPSETPIMDVEGEGRVVITASRAAELAYEETGAVDGRPPRSFFMNAIVTGIDTGGADRDNDGRISVFELYDYVYEQMEAVRTLQQPSWQGRGVGSLHIAWRRGRRTIEARTIPGPPVIVDTTIPSPRVAQVDHVRVVPILLPRPRGRAHAFRVQRWLYRVGDIVGQGTPLLEIEAGGTMYDVESPAAGTLRGISAVEGELVDGMATVGIIVIGGSNRVPAQRAVPKIGPRPVRTAVVQLPSLVGAGSATVKVWWRRIGDRIERGEALLQIAMGAIVVDITSAESGTLRAISVVEGEAAVEGETVAVIALD